MQVDAKTINQSRQRFRRIGIVELGKLNQNITNKDLTKLEQVTTKEDK